MHPEKDESVASNGWFDRFKRRHGIRFLTVSGEKLSADLSHITPFIHRLRGKMQGMGITENQLYNADESALYYRLLPKRTYVAANEKNAPGRKVSRERVTFMLCANADGSHKTKPLVIGKSKNPRCFKGFKNPLLYNHSKKAWMTRLIFKEWFHHDFVKEYDVFLLCSLIAVSVYTFLSIRFAFYLKVRQFAEENNLPPKAILIVDNCSAHEELKSDDGNIIIVALPKNVTSVLQPMDQSPIKVTKTKYRQILLSMVLAKEDIPIEQTLKEHSIRDAIVMLKDAWADVPSDLLQNAWSKIHDWDTDEDLVPLSTLQTPTDYYENILNDVQALLNQIAPTTEVSTAEIEEWNDDMADDYELYAEISDSDSESEGEAAAIVKIPHTDAIDYVNGLIKWCTQNEDVGSKYTSDLLSLRSDIVTTHTKKTTKQKSLTDYFK